MRKLLIALFIVALTASFAYAEMSAQTYSGNQQQNYREQQCFIDCYNNSGAAISSNYVVVLDTSTTNTASGTTLGTYITTTTTPANALVVGVTDQTIANGSVGRVCVRGPHKCYLTAAPSAAGATVATTTTAGAGVPWTSALPGNNQFGVALHTGVIGNWLSTGYVANGGGQSTDGSSNYWIWVGGPCK